VDLDFYSLANSAAWSVTTQRKSSSPLPRPLPRSEGGKSIWSSSLAPTYWAFSTVSFNPIALLNPTSVDIRGFPLAALDNLPLTSL